MVIGTINAVEDKKSPPVSSESVEAVSTPFRPMFKKKTDRSEKVQSNESTEVSQSQTLHSKRKEKDHVTRVSLSFDDESIIGPSIKRNKSSENDSSSSVESSESLSRREHKYSHSHHKHSSSKKHKSEKKKRKKKHSKGYEKKANKRSCEESGDDERRRNSKKKKRHEDEDGYNDRSEKYHRDKDSHHHQITKSLDKAKEDVNDKKFENRSEKQIETIIPKKREIPSPSLIHSKEKRTTSPQSKNDNNKSNASRVRNRPRAMDLW